MKIMSSHESGQRREDFMAGQDTLRAAPSQSAPIRCVEVQDLNAEIHASRRWCCRGCPQIQQSADLRICAFRNRIGVGLGKWMRRRRPVEAQVSTKCSFRERWMVEEGRR